MLQQHLGLEKQQHPSDHPGILTDLGVKIDFVGKDCEHRVTNSPGYTVNHATWRPHLLTTVGTAHLIDHTTERPVKLPIPVCPSSQPAHLSSPTGWVEDNQVAHHCLWTFCYKTFFQKVTINKREQFIVFSTD